MFVKIKVIQLSMIFFNLDMTDINNKTFNQKFDYIITKEQFKMF